MKHEESGLRQRGKSKQPYKVGCRATSRGMEKTAR